MEAAVKIVIPGKPQGKARARVTRSGFAFTPEKTANYENLVKVLYGQSYGDKKLEGQLKMTVWAYYPIPKSATKKDKVEMVHNRKRPTVKPDIDNVGKIIADSLNNIAYHDDTQIVDMHIHKFYDDNARVEVEIEVLGA